MTSDRKEYLKLYKQAPKYKAWKKVYDKVYNKKNREGKRIKLKARLKDRKEELVIYAGGKCVDCGGIFVSTVFDFHHRKPLTKKFNLGGMNLNRNWRTLLEEADKCDLLCANCHRTRHHNERNNDR